MSHLQLAGGEALRLWCPFHHDSKSKTFVLDRETGFWRCYSIRCPRHNGGGLVYLLYLLGSSWQEAVQIAASIDLKPLSGGGGSGINTQEDLDKLGKVSGAHTAFWALDWELARAYLKAWAAHPEQRPAPDLFGVKSDDPVVCCTDATFWMLGERQILPGALQRMQIGYDKEDGSFTFPLRKATGEVVGVARREHGGKFPYYVSGCAYGRRHPDYQKVHVAKGEVLWGWWEQREAIERGEPLILTEGYLDQLALNGLGYTALATLGDRLTKAQLEILESVPNPIIYWPDHDWVGMDAVGKNLARLIHRPDVRVVTHFWGKKDASRTPPLSRRLSVVSAIPALDFMNNIPAILVELQKQKMLEMQAKAA